MAATSNQRSERTGLLCKQKVHGSAPVEVEPRASGSRADLQLLIVFIWLAMAPRRRGAATVLRLAAALAAAPAALKRGHRRPVGLAQAVAKLATPCKPRHRSNCAAAQRGAAA